MKPMLLLPKVVLKKFRQTSVKMVRCVTGHHDGCQVVQEDNGDVTFREPQSSTSTTELIAKEPRNATTNSPKKVSYSPKGSPSTSPRSSTPRSRSPSPLRKTPGGSPRPTPRCTPRNSPRPSPRSSPKRTPNASPGISPSASRKGILGSCPRWSPKGTPRSSPRRTPSGSPLRSRSPSPRASRLSPKRSKSRSASINLSTSSLNSKRTLRTKRSNRSVASALDEFKFSAQKTLNEVITQLAPPERCIVINKLSNTDIRITKYDTNDNSSPDSDFGSSSHTDSDSLGSTELPILCLETPEKLPRVSKKDSPWKSPTTHSRKSSPAERVMKIATDKSPSYFIDPGRKAGGPRPSRNPSQEQVMALPTDASNRPPSFEVKVTVETGNNNKGAAEENNEELSGSGAESDPPFSRSANYTSKPKAEDPLISIFPEDERLHTASRLQCFVEERRRNGQYTAVCLVMVAAIMGLYHAFRAQNAVLAGFLVPALIMLLYLLWVLYSAQRARAKQMQLVRALGEVREDVEAEVESDDVERRKKRKGGSSNNNTNKQENGNAKKTRNRSQSPTPKRGSPNKNDDVRANVGLETAVWI